MARRGQGEGSIYQRKDGRWAAAITLENRKRKTFYGDTRKVSIAAKKSPKVPLQKSPGVGKFALALLSASLKFPRTSVL
jgi:hypothetical protein